MTEPDRSTPEVTSGSGIPIREQYSASDLPEDLAALKEAMAKNAALSISPSRAMLSRPAMAEKDPPVAARRKGVIITIVLVIAGILIAFNGQPLSKEGIGRFGSNEIKNNRRYDCG